MWNIYIENIQNNRNSFTFKFFLIFFMKPLNYTQANKLDPPEPLWHNNHINIHYYYIVELQDI